MFSTAYIAFCIVLLFSSLFSSYSSVLEQNCPIQDTLKIIGLNAYDFTSQLVCPGNMSTVEKQSKYYDCASSCFGSVLLSCSESWERMQTFALNKFIHGVLSILPFNSIAYSQIKPSVFIFQLTENDSINQLLASSDFVFTFLPPIFRLSEKLFINMEISLQKANLVFIFPKSHLINMSLFKACFTCYKEIVSSEYDWLTQIIVPLIPVTVDESWKISRFDNLGFAADSLIYKMPLYPRACYGNNNLDSVSIRTTFFESLNCIQHQILASANCTEYRCQATISGGLQIYKAFSSDVSPSHLSLTLTPHGSYFDGIRFSTVLSSAESSSKGNLDILSLVHPYPLNVWLLIFTSFAIWAICISLSSKNSISLTKWLFWVLAEALEQGYMNRNSINYKNVLLMCSGLLTLTFLRNLYVSRIYSELTFSSPPENLPKSVVDLLEIPNRFASTCMADSFTIFDMQFYWKNLEYYGLRSKADIFKEKLSQRVHQMLDENITNFMLEFSSTTNGLHCGKLQKSSFRQDRQLGYKPTFCLLSKRTSFLYLSSSMFATADLSIILSLVKAFTTRKVVYPTLSVQSFLSMPLFYAINNMFYEDALKMKIALMEEAGLSLKERDFHKLGALTHQLKSVNREMGYGRNWSFIDLACLLQKQQDGKTMFNDMTTASLCIYDVTVVYLLFLVLIVVAGVIFILEVANNKLFLNA